MGGLGYIERALEPSIWHPMGHKILPLFLGLELRVTIVYIKEFYKHNVPNYALFVNLYRAYTCPGMVLYVLLICLKPNYAIGVNIA